MAKNVLQGEVMDSADFFNGKHLFEAIYGNYLPGY
jgi:hypothetical protein